MDKLILRAYSQPKQLSNLVLRGKKCLGYIPLGMLDSTFVASHYARIKKNQIANGIIHNSISWYTKE